MAVHKCPHRPQTHRKADSDGSDVTSCYGEGSVLLCCMYSTCACVCRVIVLIKCPILVKYVRSEKHIGFTHLTPGGGGGNWRECIETLMYCSAVGLGYMDLKNKMN